MAQRDRAAMSVYRTTIAAIDNSEAVPIGYEHQAGAIEAPAVGVGRTEAQRRQLTRTAEIDIVRAELQQRLATADSVALSRPDTAAELRNEADLLQTLLDGLAG